MTSLSNKTCFLDPVPTLVVKDSIDSILPVLSEIVRRSLTQGIFPTIIKESHVHPWLKDIKLESGSFASCRAVANIFLSKVTEKFAAIKVHILDNMVFFPVFSRHIGNIILQRLLCSR